MSCTRAHLVHIFVSVLEHVGACVTFADGFLECVTQLTLRERIVHRTVAGRNTDKLSSRCSFLPRASSSGISVTRRRKRSCRQRLVYAYGDHARMVMFGSCIRMFVVTEILVFL